MERNKIQETLHVKCREDEKVRTKKMTAHTKNKMFKINPNTSVLNKCKWIIYLLKAKIIRWDFSYPANIRRNGQIHNHSMRFVYNSIRNKYRWNTKKRL